MKQQGQLDKTQSRLTLDASKATGSDKGVLKLDTYSKKEVRRWIAEYLIMDEMPFRTVQRLGFRKLVERLEPHFKMPTRFTIMKDCMELYMEEMTKLKEAIAIEIPRVCFTTDTWTSIQNVNYMCVIAHFIDRRWCLQKMILYFRHVTDHKGATISKELETCMNNWRIGKILTITVDNATSTILQSNN